jgi:hypothetical protein
MASKIPLNYFRRISVSDLKTAYNSTYPEGVVVNPLGSDTQAVENKSIYETPFDRATVIISALVTNTTGTPRTVSAGLSTRKTPITEASYNLVEFVSNFSIAPFDTVNIVVNKLVLGQYDNLYVWADADNSLNLTLSLLETVNKPS